jgi:hypothetical protein
MYLILNTINNKEIPKADDETNILSKRSLYQKSDVNKSV